VVWWNYVNNFTSMCGSSELFADESCVQSVMKKCGVDEVLINDCMADSGGVTADTTNSILDKELRLGSFLCCHASRKLLVLSRQ